MTISYHSPIPPARTGVADYSAALVEALQRLVEVEINPARSTGVDLYHVGNNGLHAGIYRRALARPGVVVLHDAVLHHFLLGQLSEQEYVEEFVYNYGEWHRGLARDMWLGRARSGSDAVYFQYGMLRRVAETARAVIVHNGAAAEMVRRHAPATCVEVVPHLALLPASPPAEFEVARVRERFGPGAIVLALLGHLRESKRVIPVLQVFKRIWARHPNAWMVVAGEFVSEDLARAAAPWLAQPGVVRLPYLSERDFWLWAHAIDVCINLRYPGAGESSGIAIRTMGIGKAVMLTTGGETAEFPDGACLRVDAGLAEQETVEAFLEWLCLDARRIAEIGACAREHVLREHGAGRVAERVAAICRSLS